MADIVIRKAEAGDMDELLRIYAAARGIMRAAGNPDQWAGGEPFPSELEEKIHDGVLYLCEEEGKPFAAFALIGGEDVTYRVIEKGQWLKDGPYYTLHRVAQDGSRHGVMGIVTAFAAGMAGSADLRADTHRDNRPMQRALEKNGFVYCGIIHLLNGDERLAYQRLSGGKER